MNDHERDPRRNVTVASADALLQPSTRRRFLRMMGIGGTITLLPGVFTACNDDLPTESGSGGGAGQPSDLAAISFDLRTDVGIFRLVHLNEMLEALLYTAVVASPTFATLSAPEQELFRDLRDVEIIHREFIGAALGDAALPDISTQLNQATIAAILSSRSNIIAAARLLENQGVAALNGAGKYLRDARNLLIAGKAVSVEARHAAALLDIAPPPGTDPATAFAGAGIVDANGLDVKLEAPVVLERVKALDLVREEAESQVTIGAAPTTQQGTPTPDFFPAYLAPASLPF